MGISDTLSRNRRVNDWIDEVGNVKDFQNALKGKHAEAFIEMARKIFWTAGQEDEFRGAKERSREFCYVYFKQLPENDQRDVAVRTFEGWQLKETAFNSSKD